MQAPLFYSTSIPPRPEEAGGSRWQQGGATQMMPTPGSLMLICSKTHSCTITQLTRNVVSFLGSIIGTTPSHGSSNGHDIDDPYAGFSVHEYLRDGPAWYNTPLPTHHT